ncbi:molecular chaperone SurA [Paramesorhizobium deserti]|uniref:Molecular chaperone SurA n=1 Tax=Paramesorhizobium deserti TaxID=1494590 RepID=A0A135HXA5_9HYPH|nr:SurA N-terminal domain-containing protein [Paramesorhizobium deserti]KXF77846.1 molecular chaperone SurA [Paramesorhizobium deserti]
MKISKRLLAAILATGISVAFLGGEAPFNPAAANEIAVLVDSNPITTYDVQRRAAFLKLQRKKGNLTQMAREELTEEMLKRMEMKRRGISISDKEVDTAFASFASRNKLTPAQLSEVLNKAGVTPEHFKTFIMVQIGWNRALSARFRQTGMISEQEAVQRMRQQGGAKPSATEYLLQQVIFVIPADKRQAIIAKRRQEANAFRSRFQNCGNTRQLAKGMIDVTVRDLGRVIEPRLPNDWADDVKKTGVGQTTPIHDTEKGVEFLAVCSTRQVSDDRVAQLVFSMEDAEKKQGGDQQADKVSEEYLKELRANAKIVNR